MKILFYCITFCFVQSIHAQNLDKLSYSDLDSLIEKLKAEDKFKEILPYAEAGLKKAEQLYGKQDTTTAKMLYYLGLAYQEGGDDSNKALEYYTQAAAIQKSKIPMSAAYANTLFAIGTVYKYGLGIYSKAEPFYLQAKDIRAKVLGEEHPDFAKSLNFLATLYRDMGNYSDAEQLLLKALQIRKKAFGDQHPEYAHSLNSLANLYKLIGKDDQAEPLLLQAKEIAATKLGESHNFYSTVLNNLAGLYRDIGQYEKAELLWLQVKAIRAKAGNEQDASYSTVLNNLASLYQSIGQYDKAETFLLQANEIRLKVLGEQHPNYANSVNNLATLYREMGDYPKATQLLLKAMDIRAKALGKEHPVFASSLSSLASLYQKTKQFDKAEPLLLQAKNIYENAFGKKHPQYAGNLNQLANFYKNIHKLDTALRYCQQSIIANCLSIDSSYQAWAEVDKLDFLSDEQLNRSLQTFLAILHTQYQQTGNPATLALHYTIAQTAIRFNERMRMNFTGEADKLRALATNSDFVLTAIKTGIALHKENYAQETFGFAETNKGVLLLEAAKTEKAYQFGDLPDSLANKEQLLQNKQSDLKAKILEKRQSPEKDSLQVVLNGVNQEMDNFTKMLRSKYPKYIALKYENKAASAADIQALLDNKTALLEYVVGDAEVYIFYIDKKNVVVAQCPIDKDSLKQNIKNYHKALSNYQYISTNPKEAYQNYTILAHWFYQNLLAPVLTPSFGGLGEVEHLIVIPDGELGHLPFETFLVEPAPANAKYSKLHYLVKDYRISYNYAATLWKENLQSPKNKNNGQVLGIASNYHVQLDSTKKEVRLPVYRNKRNLLSPLPDAQKEVENLSTKLYGTFVYDKMASERFFKANAPQYSVIHLAMHGLLDKKSPILSSLAFTEDSDSVENNFLQAYEISQMRLNADLVVLSACETGFGKFEKGNGTASLARAFMYAGVPALVVSLWEVNDASTSTLMQYFYENLQKGQDKAEALRQAKLQYLSSAEDAAGHPAFWSPFVQLGDSRPIQFASGKAWIWWLVGGLAALLVVGIAARAVVMRKK